MFVDTLINNADINPKNEKIKNSIGKFENYSIKNFKKEIEMVWSDSFYKNIWEWNVKKNFGIIVNMGSDLALIAPDHSIYHPKEKYNELKIFKPAGYSVSKFGLLGLTKYTSTYWAKKNIRCNMLVAGGVKNNQPKYLIKNLKKRIPLNRMAEPDEYKKALQFLCLDDSKYMTGQTLVLDGGRSVWWFLLKNIKIMKIKIIAEIGINHNGDIGLAKKMIERSRGWCWYSKISKNNWFSLLWRYFKFTKTKPLKFHH